MNAEDGGAADVKQRVHVIGLASVNCYLLAAGDGFVLIDAGKPESRAGIDARISAAWAARRVRRRLIVLTHGDYDHAGNAAFLRAKHGAQVAMHHADAAEGRTGRLEPRHESQARQVPPALSHDVAVHQTRPVRHVRRPTSASTTCRISPSSAWPRTCSTCPDTRGARSAC